MQTYLNELPPDLYAIYEGWRLTHVYHRSNANKASADTSKTDYNAIEVALLGEQNSSAMQLQEQAIAGPSNPAHASNYTDMVIYFLKLKFNINYYLIRH